VNDDARHPNDSPGPLVSGFDALLFDLDGVVYVGPSAVPHAADAIRAARTAGVACSFVTNNASRSALSVAEHLEELGIASTVDDVVTSPQAAVTVLGGYVPRGARVLVIGGTGIDEALRDGGYEPVRSLDQGPAAVMQGFGPDVSWRDLAEATFAVRSGLPWIATNPDLTFPTPRGVAPGNGALVRLVAETVGREPDAVAGKPEPPLLTEAIARLASERPLMIGDRLDTDIAAGSRIGIPTLLVFTGVTTIPDLLTAIPAERPTFLGADLRVLLAAYPAIDIGPDRIRCGDSWAAAEAGSLAVGIVGDPWDALRAAAATAWRAADAGDVLDTTDAQARLGAALG
jgi:glycerol-1-phosphatase